MKKIYYLLAFVVLAFASCKPLDNTYKAIDANPALKSLVFSTTTTYASNDLAKTGISATLNTKYGDAPNGSTAFVTFPYTTTAVIPTAPDFLLAHVAYTVLATDYTSGGVFTTAQAIAFLTAKYPTPVPNQLVVLTYNYSESGVTPAAGALSTDSYMYISGSWTKTYTISASQYTAANRGANGYFVTADLANIPAILSALLLDDPTIVAPKVGDIKYVSYKYNGTSQNVLALMFDGTKWADQATLNFLKLNGTWVPDPTIFITIPDSPNSWLLVTSNTAIGTAAGRTNLLFGDFDIRATAASFWADADIVKAILIELPVFVPKPITGVPYKITYYVYTGSTTTNFKTFIYNGTTFVLQ